MTTRMTPARSLLIALCLLVLHACSDNGAADVDAEDAGGWMLGGQNTDAGQDAGDAADMPAQVAEDMPSIIRDDGLVDPVEDMPAPVDEGAQQDMPAPEDLGGEDAGLADMDNEMDAPADMMEQDGGQRMEGDGCGNSSECTAGLVCCASFNGQFTCTAESACFTGGICEINEDCPGQQECCDLAQFGLTQSVCRDQCQMMGGGGGGGCMNNSECMGQGEVCCPSFQGPAACTPSTQCQTGGSCAVDTDCSNNQQCCDFFGQAALCLDQCPF